MLTITLSGLAGTLSMTLFGSMVPGLSEKYKYALLLNMLIGKGGMMHYLVGLLLAISYDWIWRAMNIEPTLPMGIAFGLVNGMVAILLAKIILIRSNSLAPIALPYFYNIMMAHLIFSAGTVLGYQLADLLRISNQVL